jgi:hypothetical protein
MPSLDVGIAQRAWLGQGMSGRGQDRPGPVVLQGVSLSPTVSPQR